MISSTTSLKCIQWNARGLTHSRLQEFKHFLSTEKPHIVLLSETHWYPWMKKFSFNCYKVARSDRRQGKGGGVAILIHDSISYATLSLPPFVSMETVGVTIMSDVGPIDVISVYCPRVDFSQLQVCELFDAPKNEFVIGGDFNAHHRLWEDCARPNRGGSALATSLTELPDVTLLTPKNLGTRMCPTTARFSTIDLTFSSALLSLDADVHLGPHHGSDHLPIFITINAKPSQAQSRAPKWIFDGNNWGKWNCLIADRLIAADFMSIQDPDTVHKTFSDALIETSKQVHRLSKFDPSTKREKPPIWYNEECIELKAEVSARIRAFRKDLSLDNLVAWKKAEAAKKRHNRKAQSQSWVNHISSLDPKSGQSKLWSLAKNLLGRGCGAPIDGISIKSPSGELLSQAEEKANLFREVFDVSSKLGDSHTEFHPSVQEHIDKEDGNGINSTMLMAEVDAMIASLKPCAMGADLIHNVMLKNLNSENKTFLLHLYNRLLATGFVPRSWKPATVIPLIKPGKPKDKATSYRPISLTSCLCKAFERIINNCLTWFLDSKGILPNFQ